MSKQVLPRLVLVSLACGLAAACTSLRVTSDVNQSLATTVKCQSYDWAGSFHGNSDLRSTVANPVNEARLRAAIAANLAAAGVRQTSENPDCLVGYGIGNRNVVEGGYGYPGYGYAGWGWGGGFGWRHGYYGAWGWDYPYVYQEGVIGVDIYDARSKQGLWHASVNQNLVGVTGDKADQKIKDAAAAIFTKYPR
jgi:Domain of unknown function (DUF4136)